MADNMKFWIDQARGVYMGTDGKVHGPPGGRYDSSSNLGSVSYTFDGSGVGTPSGQHSNYDPSRNTQPAPNGQIPSVGAGAPQGGPQSAYSGISINSGQESMPGRGGFHMPDINWGDTIRGVGSFAKNYGPLALAAWAAYQGHQNDNRARSLEDQALNEARARQARVREQLPKLREIPRPDLSYLAEDTGNPYYRRRIPAVGGSI